MDLERIDHDAREILIQGVRTVGALLRQPRRDGGPTAWSGGDPFDYAIPEDRASEAVLLEAIERTKLPCRIVTEESGILGAADAAYTIYLDPLDGSVNYSRGLVPFCIGVGVYRGNAPVLGIIYDPVGEELFVAERNRGVRVNGQPVVPRVREDHPYVHVEWFGAERYPSIVSKLRRAGIRARTAGSGVLALCYGAIGRGDGAVLVDNKPWDVAPGLVFARELDGVARQCNGEPVDLSRPVQDVVVAPRGVFDRLYAAVQ